MAHENLDFSDLRAPRGRERDLENMLAQFTKLQNSLVVFTESEFSKYTPIYMSAYSKNSVEYTDGEMRFIANLTDEYRSKIDLYKPIYIVSDTPTYSTPETVIYQTTHPQIYKIDGKNYVYFDKNEFREILFILPEILQKFNSLKTEEGKEAVDICQNITANAHDQPWKVAEAVTHLAQHVFASQDMKQTEENGKRFMQHVVKLHNSKYFNTKITKDGTIAFKEESPNLQVDKNVRLSSSNSNAKRGEVSLDDLFD